MHDYSPGRPAAWRPASAPGRHVPAWAKTVGLGCGLLLGAPAALQAQGAGAPASAPVSNGAVLVVDDGQRTQDALAGATEAVRRFRETGGGAEVVGASDAKAEEVLRNLAQAGRSPLVVIGGNAAGAVEKVAAQFPYQRFTLIGAATNGVNVRSVLFRDVETAWLAGFLAAKLTGNSRIGFVGGPPGPDQRRDLCAAVQGMLDGDGSALMFPDMMGAPAEPRPEAQRGAQLATGQIDRAAGVIITPAGPAGAGALNATRDLGALAIVRNGAAAALYPRNVAATQLRRVDNVAFDALTLARTDAWRAGQVSVGLAQNALELRLSDSVAPPISPELRADVARRAADIGRGVIIVQDMSDGRCPGRWSPQRADAGR